MVISQPPVTLSVPLGDEVHRDADIVLQLLAYDGWATEREMNQN